MMSLSISITPVCHLTADEPVSTIPAVSDRMVVEPYWMDSSIPQNPLAGEVAVMGLFMISHKQVEKIAQCIREGDRTSEFAAVGSTCAVL